MKAIKNFNDLVGSTIEKIEGCEVGSDSIQFVLSDGRKYRLHHKQGCCESVSVVDVCGDIKSLIGMPLTMADESTNSEDPMDLEHPESFTWTYYKLATAKGFLDIRWLGTSNGYYSEGVDFDEVRL